MIEKRTHWSPATQRRIHGAYIPPHILSSKHLTPAAKIVYGIMHTMQGRNSTEFLTDYSEIASLFNSDRKTVRRCVKALQNLGHLIVHRPPKADYPGLFELPHLTRSNAKREWARRREDQNPKIKRMPAPKVAQNA